jgi:Tfp pilus assembly protein PilZ
MGDGERGSYSVLVPAAKARALLAGALELLQRDRGPSESLAQAVSEVAAASSHLYRAQAEARTLEAALHGIRAAAQKLDAALGALEGLRGGRADADGAAGAIAQALAVLYPIVQATLRQRREVRFAHQLTLEDRAALRNGVANAVDPGRSALPEGGERRAAPRRAELELDVGMFSGTQFYKGSALNLGCGGLFVSSTEPLQVGTELSLCFILSGDRAIEARGAVRWSCSATHASPAGLGVAFSALAPDELVAIRLFCSESHA